MSAENVIRQSSDQLAPVKDFPACRIGELRNGIVVRMPDHLGEAVMALPALAALKNILPETCGLFVAAPANHSQLYQALPIVDGIVPLAVEHRFRSKGEKKAIRQLHAGAAVLFNDSFSEALALKLAGISALYGESVHGRRWLLKGKFSFEKKFRDRAHFAGRCMSIVRALGGNFTENILPQFVIPCGADELTGPVTRLFYHPMVLVIAPGAGELEYYIKTAAWWIRRGGIAALCGIGGESGICEAIRAELPENKAFNLCGRTDIFALMHLLRFSRFVIAGTSGVMHLAAALNLPGLAITRRGENTGALSLKPVGNGDEKITPFAVIRAVRRELCRKRA